MLTYSVRIARGRLATAVVLVGVAVIWVRVNSPFEGPVLIVFTRNHGLTVADLPSIAAVVVAVLLVWTGRRPRPHSGRDGR